MGKNNNIGTFNVNTGSYIVTSADGVGNLSLTLSTGGSATITGSSTIRAFGGASGPIPLTPEVPFLISAFSENLIDGLTINVVTGTVLVVCNQ